MNRRRGNLAAKSSRDHSGSTLAPPAPTPTASRPQSRKLTSCGPRSVAMCAISEARYIVR